MYTNNSAFGSHFVNRPPDLRFPPPTFVTGETKAYHPDHLLRWPVSGSTTLPDNLPLPKEAYSISVGSGTAHPEAHPTKLQHQQHHHQHHEHQHAHQHGQAIEYNAKFARWLKGVRQEVSRACFQLLFFSIRKSHGNQIFAARSLSVFVTHSSEISCGSVAIRCIREMVRIRAS